MIVNTNCKYFKGDIPCLPHKNFGYKCESCPSFEKIDENILIIKLGAIGDVIRTTPLLRKIRDSFPGSYITWLTYSPEILSKNWVNRILDVKLENLELLKQINFDWLINLDKDPVAISLTNSIKAKKKSGFTIDNFGHAKPIGTEAENHKWQTGLFDDVNKLNTKHYVQEIFEICDFKFQNEEYILEVNNYNILNWNIDKNKVTVGLNTGCGGRWTSRLWPVEYWIELAKELLQNNFEVILLGGEQENNKNIEISKTSGAKYFGFYTLNEFTSLMNQCDIIVSAVTMAMHIAIALKKKLILFNNIFNKNEFYLYNRGHILEPDFDCDCYFSPTCKNNCMQYLYPKTILGKIQELAK